MHSRETIRRILALGLLLLFVFSATPKRLLHHALADHQDCTRTFGEDAPTIKESRFHCGYDHQVVEAPFSLPPSFALPDLFPSFTGKPSHSLFSSTAKRVRATVNKGPPAPVCS